MEAISAGTADQLHRRAAPDTLQRFTDRRRLRHARWRLVTLTAIAVAVGATLHTLWQADAARASWADVRLAVVTTAEVPAGSQLTTGDLRVVELPAAAIAAGAVADPVGDLVGRSVTQTMFAGEVVVEQRLGPAGLSATASRIPRGHRAVAVPMTSTSPPLAPGDRVDLISVTPTARVSVSGAARPGATTIATGVEVLEFTPTTLTVIVDDASVSDLAQAVVNDTVVTVLVGG